MKIPFQIVLDCLSEYRCDVHTDTEPERYFDRATLPPREAAALRPDWLYVCTLTQAMQLNRDGAENCCFICQRDRLSDDTETEDLLRNTVVINENIPVERLFEHVQDTFCSIQNWYTDAQDSVIRGRSLQEIVDLSEPILQNYVQITDSSFKLLAYTRHTECDEPITVLARKYGYHPESTVSKFKKYRRFDAWERATGTFVNDSHEFTPYTLISKIFKFQNTYFAHAVMTCNNRPATRGMVELFDMFMDIIGIYVENYWKALNSCTHLYDSFLMDLLDGAIHNREMMEERAKHVSIPFRGLYTLCVTAQDESGRFSAARMLQELTDNFPNDRALIYRGQLVLLTSYDRDCYLQQRDERRKALLPLLEKYETRCGISSFFSCLTEAQRAFREAGLALKFSGQTPGADDLPDVGGKPSGLQSRCTVFEDSFAYIIIGSSEQNGVLWQESIYHDALRKLKQYDEAHGQNNFQLLYLYLMNERRSTETAETLHMSRNNVIYRIGRIKEMLNMDFDDPTLRQRMLLGYTLYQLYGLG